MSNVTADQARDEIAAIYREWTEAVSTVKDYAFLDRHIDDSWTYTDFKGTQRGKREYKELVGIMVWYAQDMQRLDARMIGEHTAIVTGVYRSRAELTSGAKLDSTIIFSGVWENQGGVWRALLHHTTKITDPAYI